MTGSESPGRPQFHLEMHPLLLPTNASSVPAKTNYLFFLQTITLMSIEKSPFSQLRKPEQRLRLLLKLAKERLPDKNLQNWEERTQQGENYNKKDKTHVQYELQ
jgi:hypothetical protein